MNRINTTWVSGTPRTGSMLTYNITRDLFRSAHIAVMPEVVPKDETGVFGHYATAIQDTGPTEYVLKTHRVLASKITRSRIVVNIRNPFEICASYKKFMDCDTSTAVKVALNHIKIIRHYQAFSSEVVSFVRYENLTTSPYATALELTKFLGLILPEEAIRASILKWDKDNVSNKIQALVDQHKNKIEAGEHPPLEEFVPAKNGFRSFDLLTGFQSGHISNITNWKQAFSQSEISEIIELLNEPAKELGYNLKT